MVTCPQKCGEAERNRSRPRRGEDGPEATLQLRDRAPKRVARLGAVQAVNDAIIQVAVPVDIILDPVVDDRRGTVHRWVKEARLLRRSRSRMDERCRLRKRTGQLVLSSRVQWRTGHHCSPL